MFDPMTMISTFVRSNPQLAQYWNVAQQMTQGKTPQEIQTIAQNLAKQRGIDMNEVGRTIQQFIGGNR